jgi:hypothetical protein
VALPRWKAPNQSRAEQWLRAVWDHLSDYLARAFATSGVAGGAWTVTNQSVPTGAVTVVQWDNEVEDSDGFLDVPSGTWICKVPGVYAFHCSGNIAVTTGRVFAQLTVNLAEPDLSGLSDASGWARDDVSVTEDRFNLVVVVRMAVNDTMQLRVLHSEAGAANCSAILTAYKLPDTNAFITGDEVVVALGNRVSTLESDTRRVGFYAIKTTTQSLPDGVSTTIVSYDNVVQDTEGTFNATTGVYTIPSDGVYSITFGNNTAIVVGATRIFGQVISSNASHPPLGICFEDDLQGPQQGRFMISGTWRFQTGNTVEGKISQLSGAPRNASGIHFNIWRVSD